MANEYSNVDLASLIGTWLGTLFTAVGLLTIFAKLRSILNDMRYDHASRMKKIAGDWASCVLEKIPPQSDGILEGAVPNFTAWLQRAYLEDRAIRTSMDDRGDCGRAGWSKLSSRLDVRPGDLVAFGGPGERADFPMLEQPRGINIRIRIPRKELGDVLAQNDSLFWGLSASDFAAVVIIAGFRPWDFSSPTLSRSTGYRGQMLVADFSPFAKLAKFDTLHAFHDASFKFQYDWQTNSDPLQQIDVPVGHAIQLAYGMIRTRPRCNREWIILPEHDKLEEKHDEDENKAWTRYPSVSRLRYLQKTCEAFAGVTEIHVVDYAHEHGSHLDDDHNSLFSVLRGTSAGLTRSDCFTRTKAREIMNIAFTIASVRPWGAIPVLHRETTRALRWALEPFFPLRPKTVGRLNAELLELTTVLVKTPTMTANLGPQQHIRFLSFVSGEKDSFFDGATSCCRFYFEAMTTVLLGKGILLEEVRIALAAQVALSRLGSLWSTEANLNLSTKAMRAFLGSRQAQSPPDWALDVYCGFLWGWVNDSIPMDPILIDKLPRRVFLG